MLSLLAGQEATVVGERKLPVLDGDVTAPRGHLGTQIQQLVGTAYTKAGLSPDGASSYYLPRLIGVRRTQELMITNRTLSAAEASQWGLVTEVVADAELAGRTDQLAGQMASGARKSNAAVKKLLLTSLKNSLEEQMEIEGRLIAECADSADGREGVDAFMAKRPADFA